MRSVNKVILIGNLTRDPEMRQTPNGQFVTTFGIATNRDWVTRDNKRHSLPEFHDLVAWAKLAEICNQYLKKGKLIYIEGYLKTRSWDAPEGIKKFKTEIVVQDMIMLDRRQAGENGEMDYIPEENMMNNAPMEDQEMEPKVEKKTSSAPQPAAKPPESVKTSSIPSTPQSISIDEDLGL